MSALGITTTLLVALTTSVFTTSPGSSPATPLSASARPGPGATGPVRTLDSDATTFGFDARTAADGTTYVAWISSHDDGAFDQVHLCVLAQGGHSCTGGVQTTSGIEPISASSVHVVDAGGGIELVWRHETETSPYVEMGDRIAVAEVHDGILQPGTDVAQAPSFGTLTSVVSTPSGTVSAAVVDGAGDEFRTVYYYPTLATPPTPLRAPYSVETAELADDGHQTVLVVGRVAGLTDALGVAWKPSAGQRWRGFRRIRHTWTDHDTARVMATPAGIHLVATGPSSLYRPSAARWSRPRKAFTAPVHAFARTSCPDSSRDLSTDASSRLALVRLGCGKLMISNLPGTTTGTTVTVPAGLTRLGEVPQIATSPSGRGWVIWLRSGTHHDNRDDLVARPVQLPGLARTVHRHGRGGLLTLTGPASCLPTVTVKVGLHVRAAPRSRVVSTSLTLAGHRVGGSLDGSGLRPGHHYRLRGAATLSRRDGSGRTHVLARKLGFTTCPRP